MRNGHLKNRGRLYRERGTGRVGRTRPGNRSDDSPNSFLGPLWASGFGQVLHFRVVSFGGLLCGMHLPCVPAMHGDAVRLASPPVRCRTNIASPWEPLFISETLLVMRRTELGKDMIPFPPPSATNNKHTGMLQKIWQPPQQKQVPPASPKAGNSPARAVRAAAAAPTEGAQEGGPAGGRPGFWDAACACQERQNGGPYICQMPWQTPCSLSSWLTYQAQKNVARRLAFSIGFWTEEKITHKKLKPQFCMLACGSTNWEV